MVEEKQHTDFVCKMFGSKSWLAFLVRLLSTIFGFFIGAFIGQIFVIEYHIDYANVLGALCSGLIVGIPLLGPFINEALTERAKKIEQEREHYLKGLDTVMDYAKMYYVPLFKYAYSTAFVLKTAKNEREHKYAFFWLGKTFQKRAEVYFEAGGFIKLQDLTEELTSEILFRKGRDCLPFDYCELTCLIKYTTEKSKISPLYYDFYTDLDNKNKEINKIYVKFEEWVTSSDTNEQQKVDEFIKYLHCFASHMRCQLNQMYSGWYQKELPIIIPEYCDSYINSIKETIIECENEGRDRIYEKLGICHL